MLLAESDLTKQSAEAGAWQPAGAQQLAFLSLSSLVPAGSLWQQVCKNDEGCEEAPQPGPGPPYTPPSVEAGRAPGTGTPRHAHLCFHLPNAFCDLDGHLLFQDLSLVI